MTFPEGWLQQQIDSANQTIGEWSDKKRAVMLKENREEPRREEVRQEEEVRY